MSLFDLTDRTVVVTGARGFLGRPICAALAEAGATVVGLDCVSVPKSLLNQPGIVQTFGDVLAPDSLSDVLRNVVKSLPDGLLLLHGLDPKPGQDATDPWRDWQAMIDVNLTGTANACRVFGTAMAEAGRGSIVTVGSAYALNAPDQRIYADGFVKPAAYSAGKSGVVGLTRWMAGYWAHCGVRVNCLTPGGIESAGQPPEFREKFIDRVPLGRMGQPADLVGAIVYLLSDASAYTTGQNIVIDGGFGVW